MSKKSIPLEALRGLASVVVVLMHAMYGFFPGRAGIFPDFDQSEAINGEWWFFLLNGNSAVYFFFVLSGYVLTKASIENRDPTLLIRGAIKRWPRLAAPVLLTTIASYLLFVSGLYSYEAAGAITNSPWLATFAYAYEVPFAPSIVDAAAQGSFLTFFRGDAYYDSSLWTMKFEFWGSFFAFGLAALLIALPRTHNSMRWFLVAVSILLCHFSDQTLTAFPVGVSLSLLNLRSTRKMSAVPALLCLAISLYLLGLNWPVRGAFAAFGALLPSGIPYFYGNILGSALLILTVERTTAIGRILSAGWARTLGEISFPLYLVHALVICSLGSRLFLATLWSLPVPWPNFIATAAAIVASFLAAWPLVLFNRWWLSRINASVESLLIDAN